MSVSSTPRTKTQLLRLLKDQQEGSLTPEHVRDMVASMTETAYLYDATGGHHDVTNFVAGVLYPYLWTAPTAYGSTGKMSVNPTTGVFTVGTSGVYLVLATVPSGGKFYSGTPNVNCSPIVQKNGSQFLWQPDRAATNANYALETWCLIGGVYSLTGGDFLRFGLLPHVSSTGTFAVYNPASVMLRRVG